MHAPLLSIVNIVGARPNLVKMAAVLAAQRARPDMFTPLLVHTRQHDSPAMSDRLFAELELPPPDIALASGRDGHAAEIGPMVSQLERLLARVQPDLVVVVGDVNSSAAGAVAAATLGIPVAHVEAGLRSFDRTMPEEVNRIRIDAVSDYLFASEASGVANLAREGRPAEAVHHVGNVMIDTLVRFRPRAVRRNPAAAVGVARPYGVLTLHRPSNVDRATTLEPLLREVGKAARHLPIVFPVHPRTRDRLDAAGLGTMLAEFPGLRPIPPVGYLDMLALLEGAHLVLTDSGGVQEETTYLGVPCLTLRDTTERPATVSNGTNRVVGARPQRLLAEIERVLAGDRPPPRRPPLWDGRAAERIAEVLAGVAGTRARPRRAAGQD